MLEAQVPLCILPTQKRQRVERHLNDLLQSDAFSSSRRSREFLRYIVEESIAGRGPAIKERNIAVDVFGKGTDFDSQVESIVRVKAAEVRKRLAQAYKVMESPEVRIELPVGNYHPIFHFKPLGEFSEVLHLPSESSGPAEAKALSHKGLTWTTGLCAAVILSVLASTPLRRRSSFDLLWDPLLRGHTPVLISVPAPTIYELTNSRTWLPFQPGALIPASQLVERDVHYVGVGAAAGAARFGEQLGLRHRSFTLKFGSDVSFSDLRQGPAILLGGKSSHWTVEMTRTLPIRFDEIEQGKIVDSADRRQTWQEHGVLHDEPHVGYALVSRLLRSESGNVVLMVAGITAYDTQAAVEFLTHEESFDSFTKQAPGWATKNFQVLLRSSIHGHTPGPPVVVTQRVW